MSDMGIEHPPTVTRRSDLPDPRTTPNVTYDPSPSALRAASSHLETTTEYDSPSYVSEYRSRSAARTKTTVDDAFDHALTHAIENAIVHAETPEPSVRIVVDESLNTGRVEIRIEDECPSIPNMEIEAVSEHTETTTTSHGSGVGLFVMKWCIESLGGELKIERHSGRGNSVYFYLPPKESPDSDSEATAHTAGQSTESVSRQRSTE